MYKILPQSDSPKVRKAKECNLPYQENIAEFLCLVFFLLFVMLEWHILLFFSSFSYTPVYVRLTHKKRLCNLNFTAQIISSKFVIDQKLRHFKVLLAVNYFRVTTFFCPLLYLLTAGLTSY